MKEKSKHLKIVSYNINGIRGGIRKGFLDWLPHQDIDILCLQEVKALPSDVPFELFHSLGFKHIHWHSAQKKGYSGVAVLSKEAFLSSQKGIGIETFDKEGRFLQVETEHFYLINSYFPSGSSGDERQTVKYDYLDAVYCYLKQGNTKPYIVCGDYNICHKAIDIHAPKRNEHTSGFLPEERAWMDKLVNLGYIDSFRRFNQEPHYYTWWSYRAQAKAKNLGWRIDYFMLQQDLIPNLQAANIHKEVPFSDHCPLDIHISF